MTLTTAEILYRIPDTPSLLQTFIWQDYDTRPTFPKLVGFVTFWDRELDGKIFKVRVANSPLISPAELKVAAQHGRLVLN